MSNFDHADRLKSMLLQVSPDSQVQTLAAQMQRVIDSSGSEGGLLESASQGSSQGGEQLEAYRPGDLESVALESLDSLARYGIEAPLTEVQQDALEAIVLPRLRPVLNIVNDTFSAPSEPWEHLGKGYPKQRIDAAIKSIGRIEVPRHPRLIPYAGTGFVVGRSPGGGHLLMTNRHVAQLFATGIGQRNLAFQPGQEVAVDFKREVVPTPPELLTVESVVMIHPYWDMALLRVAGLAHEHPVLSLSTEDPAEAAERDVVVIGYPAQDRRNNLELQNRIFGGVFEVKRMQPGKVKLRSDYVSYGRRVSALTHDSSTLAGNSGSAVLDFSDPAAEAPAGVIGLHFAGEYLKANYAVPAFDLAQDSRVVDAGVNFVGRLEPRVDFYGPFWKVAENSNDHDS